MKKMTNADRISPFFGKSWPLAVTVKYHEDGACYLPRPWLFWGFASALQLTSEEMLEAAYYSRSKAERLRSLTALRTDRQRRHLLKVA